MNCTRGGGGGGGCRRCSTSTDWLRKTLLLGLIWLLLIGVVENAAGKLVVNARREKRQELLHHKSSGINVVIKRKVPQGPDPIHNRRAGNSHRPPGRA